MDRQVVDDPFVKYLLDNLHGEGKIFLQNLINCNENLETLTKLIPLLMSDINFYRKDCLIPMIVEKSIEICSKFEKKRKLDELRERAKELSEATDKEKTQYERSLAYRNKEIDFSRKCENSQLFYENKMSEYYKQIKQLENLLVNVGFYDELSEQSIKTLEQDNNLLKDQIKEINDKLTYYTFQPDEESLKKTIESLRNEIEIMNEDLERVIEGSTSGW
ncbi:uncharacterized protein LOC128389622 [Panonychus citri]|uniref:uncharacterized protein LOC128389622 n=1 Tax=Panonychus citri TaxID=50023 RepID=UPI0023070C03|nr:uncharacterized protein LOC128389622 [Panonychus citri]